MSFRSDVDQHIEQALVEGILPDSDTVVEMEVPNQKPGPQHSGDEGGPKSPPSRVFPWMMTDAPPKFKAPGRTIPPAKFRDQNAQIPPARFGSAAVGMKEDVLAAVMADLGTLQDDAE